MSIPKDTNRPMTTAEAFRLCVCGHEKIDHELQPSDELGEVLGCRHADCACGPGCIHEGFVDADEQRTRATNDAPSIRFLRAEARTRGLPWLNDVADEIERLRKYEPLCSGCGVNIDKLLARGSCPKGEPCGRRFTPFIMRGSDLATSGDMERE